ncbi:DNA polymerase III subunit epsilon [Moraxella nasovis]|uniref:DNA polymerase III subunit epsilon n=1 Tax=Moraxella nasovis TaxID=2904121 RepID=UPI001F609A0F|nr:DNA polymerase III subunit epsilon [Moraxella nasovis]UNU73325.1 DNA polymerase III subunit epsilon [Moraxella nasovis]
MINQTIAYTDGACKGNGKNSQAAGGFGVHIHHTDGNIENIWGGDADTTNNRMELMAAIVALQNTPSDVPLQLWTDSNYVKQGMSEWLDGWKQKNWQKADGKSVINLDLWQKLDELRQNRTIEWCWVKGHAGHAGNTKADHLANLGVTSSGRKLIKANETTDGKPDDAPPQEHAIDVYQQGFAVSPNDAQNPAYDGKTSQANADFWAILPKPSNQNSSNRQLIMDTETTGFEDQNGDRIVEVGIIEMVGRKFTGNQLHVYINPDKQMDEEVIRIHGISNEFLEDKPKFKDVAQAIYDFMVGSEVIAHNAPFDMRFLKMEFDKVGLTDFSERVKVTDSLDIAKQLYPGQKNSLDALRRRLNVGTQDRTFHGALLDSEILAEVYLAMTGGQMAINMDDYDAENQTNTGLASFRRLNDFADGLRVSASDIDGDAAWRAAILK